MKYITPLILFYDNLLVFKDLFNVFSLLTRIWGVD